MVAVAQAGVITGDLQAAADTKGLLYPPDPSSLNHYTLGGNVACNAGGPRCLKYGVTRDYVLALQVVRADGQTMRVGSRTAKNATGYSLAQLFVGSESTLGVVTDLVTPATATCTPICSSIAVTPTSGGACSA
jgi:glycolate oxidase